MNDFPRQMLRRIVAKHGRDVCGDARRCENLLKDLCGAYNREINVLIQAVEENVPLDLLAGSRAMPLELLLKRLEKQLEERTALTEDAARWAVESWALALNLATENEIAARQKRIEPAPAKKQNLPINPSAGKIPSVAPDPVKPPQARTFPPPSPRVNPPIVPPPPRAAPPVVVPKNNAPVNTQPVQSPPVAQPARKSFGLLRGCLLVFFLLAVASTVLFFGVPFAIEVMRDTQREKSVEPPRFPAR